MILVAGSANLDFVVRASHIPLPGETVLGRDFKTFPGGKGANQAVACARAGGVETHFLSAMGTDTYADLITQSLANAQVVLHTVSTADQPTGTAFICLSDDAENAITVAPGANNLLAPSHLPPLAGFSHLLMQLETPLATVVAFAQAAKAQGVQVVLNAAPAATLAPKLLALVDVLVVNEGELATVAQHTGSIAECLERIHVPTVVVTLGHRGCCARHLGQLSFHKAFTVVPLDTTAAGDTFCGALVAALSRGVVLEQALGQASAAGALACTRLGAQTSIPTHEEVLNLMAQQPLPGNDTLPGLRHYCGLTD
jgi:ribokinase